MNIKYVISYILFLFLSFTSCNNDENSLTTQGYLELGVSKNLEVITRASDVEEHSLSVDICAGANDSIVKHFSDYNDMEGERVLLEVGTYKIKVKSNPYSELEFEQPTFYGEKTNVSVTAGKTTQISVECLLSCVKITTEFTKPVKDSFESVVARISDKSGSYLNYDLNETRAGYFQPGYILVDLTLTNKEGYEFKMSKLIDNTEARDHYHLVFDMIESGDNNSGMDFDISIETDPTNDENHTVTVPLPETGYKQDPPVIKFVDGDNIEIENNKVSKNPPTDETTQEPISLYANVSSINIGLKSVTMLASSTDDLSGSWDLLDEANYSSLSGQGIVINKPEKLTETLVVNFSEFATNIEEGTHEFNFVVLDNMGHESIEKVTIKVNPYAATLPADSWAYFATLKGYVNGATPELAANYQFEYRKQNEENWVIVNDLENPLTVLPQVESDDTNITQVLIGLDINTTYEYRLVNEGNPSESKIFITEGAEQLPNSGFEDWYNDTNGLPKPATNANNIFWDCGNSKAFGLVEAIMTTQDSENKVIGNSSTKMETKETATILGAGNIFTGSFTLDGTNGILDLGRDFKYRPNKLTGYYNYISKIVNHPKGHLENGADDICSIYIALTTKHITINTGEKIYFDPNDPCIVAYGSLADELCSSTDGFQKFEIQLEYRSLEKPKYIIVVASSSKYGDYFEGGVGSTLWLDEISLTYPESPNDITYKSK